jgi:ribosomal protein L23
VSGVRPLLSYRGADRHYIIGFPHAGHSSGFEVSAGATKILVRENFMADFNVSVNQEVVGALNALPAFKKATDGALIKAAERKFGYSGVKITSRTLAIAILMGARSLDDPELQRPLNSI